jgi:hypothetical protein
LSELDNLERTEMTDKEIVLCFTSEELRVLQYILSQYDVYSQPSALLSSTWKAEKLSEVQEGLRRKIKSGSVFIRYSSSLDDEGLVAADLIGGEC